MAAAGGDESGKTGRGRRSRLLSVVLVASLALNAFLIAAVGGSLVRDPGAKKGGHRGGPMRSFLRETPELREIAQQLREERRAAHRQARRAKRDAYAAYREALSREPLDAAALDAAEARVVDAVIEMRRLRQAALRALIEEMTPAQREAFAQHLAEREAKRRERRKRMREEDGRN